MAFRKSLSAFALKDNAFAGFGNDDFRFGQFPIQLELEPLDRRAIAVHKNYFFWAQRKRICEETLAVGM